MQPDRQTSRREFLEATGPSVASASGLSAQTPDEREIPRRPLGNTGVSVPIIGVGGYHLGSAKELDEARKIVDASVDAGINFFDNAWDYHDGRSEEWLGSALKGKRDKVVLMTKVCTHGREVNVRSRVAE